MKNINKLYEYVNDIFLKDYPLYIAELKDNQINITAKEVNGITIYPNWQFKKLFEVSELYSISVFFIKDRSGTYINLFEL